MMRLLIFVLLVFVVVNIIVLIIGCYKNKKQENQSNKPDKGFFN